MANIGMTRTGTDPPVTLSDQIRSGVIWIGRWWLREFHTCMPKSLFAWFGTERSAHLVIQPADAGVTATLLDRSGRAVFVEPSSWADYSPEVLRKWRETAAAHDPTHELILGLSSADAIQNSLTLPLQAEAKIEDILREQIARRTPLDPDQVLSGYIATPIEGKKIRAQYLLVPKLRLERVLARLGLFHGAVAAIAGPNDDVDPAPRIRLLPGKKRALRLSKPLASALLAASVALLVLAIGGTLWRQQILLSDVEQRTDLIAAPAHDVTNRLKEIHDVNSRVAELIEIRSTPKIVHIWDELAQLVPQTTYLTAVEIRGQELQLNGLSAAAIDLIPVLERSAMFSTVELSGPATMDRTTGKEQFSLRAKMRKPRIFSDGSE
jgi:general secretion pathway protein L